MSTINNSFLSRTPFRAAILVSLALVAGCGSGGGGGPCGDPLASCSNDPTGSFHIVSVCGLSPMGCPEATSSVNTRSATGSLTINADGSGGLDLDLEFTYTAKVPKSCGLTCEEVDELIGLCDDTGDKCSCAGSAGMGLGASLTWRLEGNDVVLDFGYPEETGELCVSGDLARSHTYDGLELLWERD